MLFIDKYKHILHHSSIAAMLFTRFIRQSVHDENIHCRNDVPLSRFRSIGNIELYREEKEKKREEKRTMFGGSSRK